MSRLFWSRKIDTMNDPLEEFIEFDAIVGADVVKCPHCSSSVSRSFIFDDDVKCPDCGEMIKS